VTSFVRLREARLATLAAAYGGGVRGAGGELLGRFVPLEVAGAGDLAPLLSTRFVRAAREARARGATLLVEASLESLLLGEARSSTAPPLWVHPFASWAMAKVLEGHAVRSAAEPVLGVQVTLGPHVVLSSGVVLGDRVTIGASSVVGSPGFGWATGPGGEHVRVPQLGGVIVEDDVSIGPLVTVDAGTLGPTILGRGVKLDAHVHVGHNCEIGEGTLVAAQAGFAGSVKLGRGVLVGGQVGIADHVTVGDGARIAAKSGVIGDIPAGAVVAGYPAVARGKWLRGLAGLYRRRNESNE
jgi:UDP-3-O-[3-hydroxymyristoyl] glucosamine N-acyltransferase